MEKMGCNISMSIKNLLLKTARSRIGGSLVCFCFRYCAGLVPLKAEAKSKEYIMVRHPQPAARVHYIIVPRFRVCDICELLLREDEWAAFGKFIRDNVSFDNVSLCCNYGVRQEVGQVHFHVMGKKALEAKDGAEIEECEINSRKAGFSSRGNIYVTGPDLSCADFLRDVIDEGKSRFPAGFSVIFK